jgi:hypothetical protein
MSRILRLALLAPRIVDAISDRRHTEEMILQALLKTFPVWADKQVWLAGDARNPMVEKEAYRLRLRRAESGLRMLAKPSNT